MKKVMQYVDGQITVFLLNLDQYFLFKLPVQAANHKT